MINNLQVVHKIDSSLIFKGLNIEAIKYLKRSGLWMPLSDSILSLDEHLEGTSCQIYVKSPNYKEYLTFIIEDEEFLTGQIYEHVDNDAKGLEGYLHQYSMEDGEHMFEIVQAIHNGILFLALADSVGNFVLGWTNNGIEKILNN